MGRHHSETHADSYSNTESVSFAQRVSGSVCFTRCISRAHVCIPIAVPLSECLALRDSDAFTLAVSSR